jgi:hypothetical protein
MTLDQKQIEIPQGSWRLNCTQTVKPSSGYVQSCISKQESIIDYTIVLSIVPASNGLDSGQWKDNGKLYILPQL